MIFRIVYIKVKKKITSTGKAIDKAAFINQYNDLYSFFNI